MLCGPLYLDQCLLPFHLSTLQEELLFSKKKREDKKRNKNKLKSKLCDEDIPDLADMLGKKLLMWRDSKFKTLCFGETNDFSI